MATNLTDPVVLLSLGQTVVLALTLLIFIFQFRSQNEAIKDAAYQKALDDQTAAFTMLVEHPELGGLVEDLARIQSPSGPVAAGTLERNRAVFGYMLLNYSLFERVYLLYARKWIDKDTWDQWHRWMRTMAKHPAFQEVHRRSEGTFDRKFQRLVEEAMASKRE